MLRYGPTSTAANELPAVDFVAVAAAFGISAQAVDGVGPDFAKALAGAVNAGGPQLLHVRASLHPPVTTTPFWPINNQG
jgi:thiamine pyrophosphate-dependent acetolactate synthase large subunit-like protein